jgi:hypothetical protein
LIGNALEQEIIDLYSDNPSSLFSINQIATKLGKKYPYINKKVTILVKNNIFKKTIVGRSHLCSLNLQNDETIYLLILNEIKRKKQTFEAASQKATKILSYSSKIAKASGANLVLKIKDEIFFVVDKKEEVLPLEKSIIPQMLQDLSPVVIDRAEFLSRLKKDPKLQEDKIIMLGFEKYYDYIREIEDELKIKYSRIIP